MNKNPHTLTLQSIASPPPTVMNHRQDKPDLPLLLRTHSSSSPVTSTTTTATVQRRVAIAIDLSDESAYAVKWAVKNYLQPGDAVILLHVRPTSALYGADWGSIKLQIKDNDECDEQKLEDNFENFTSSKVNSLAQPLVEAEIPFKIRIVRDRDLKERLCLEVERLGLSAMIMGSRGFGATRRKSNGRLGSVSDYCVNYCICPVLVVRFPDDDGGDGEKKKGIDGKEAELELDPVPEEEHDVSDEEVVACLQCKIPKQL